MLKMDDARLEPVADERPILKHKRTIARLHREHCPKTQLVLTPEGDGMSIECDVCGQKVGRWPVEGL